MDLFRSQDQRSKVDPLLCIGVLNWISMSGIEGVIWSRTRRWVQNPSLRYGMVKDEFGEWPIVTPLELDGACTMGHTLCLSLTCSAFALPLSPFLAGHLALSWPYSLVWLLSTLPSFLLLSTRKKVWNYFLYFYFVLIIWKKFFLSKIIQSCHHFFI